MDIIHDVEPLRSTLAAWRALGQRIAFVPTMGNLHDGHFALVRQARECADRVVVSIFVNPTQFGPNEDFERYPRTPDDDIAGLIRHGCDLLFMPQVATLYPLGMAAAFRVSVPMLADVLCGARRPGHFDGVATVVSRLFTLVNPDVAVFGEKDFQQLRIVEQMTRDLGFATSIVRGPTVREPDGLALSSRNRYLDPAQRRQAPALHAVLSRLAETFAGGASVEQVETEAGAALAEAGLDLDYLEIRRESDLERPGPGERDGLRAFVAARLGGTRLIDNIALGSSANH